MARVFTDGAETGDVTFFNYSANTTAETTDPRSGSYHYKALSASDFAYKNINTLSEFYLRFAMRPATLGEFYIYFKHADWPYTMASIKRNTSTNVIEAWIGNLTTLAGSSTATISDSSWYLFEVYFKLDNTTGRFVVKMDGVTEIDFTGDTNWQAWTGVQTINFVGTGTFGIYFDDIALNDTTGGVDDSWCGDGKVIALIPNGNGDSSQWTGSDADQTDNYLLIDELPPSDADYVETSTSANIDNYALGTYTLAAGESVLRVWATAIAKDTASAGTLKLGLKTASTNYTDVVNVGTSFGRVNGAEYKVNPNTGVAWTQAQLDALQLTIEMP